MDSREALLLAKLGKKPQDVTVGSLSDVKIPTADVGKLSGIKTPTAEVGGLAGLDTAPAHMPKSMEVIKAYRAMDMKTPMTKKTLEADVTLGPTEAIQYTPVKSYLKKKGK